VTVSSWERVKELLHQAVALGPGARAKFLDEVCAADTDLRAELDSLLLADAYGAVRSRWTPHPPGSWERLQSALHR